MKFKYTLSKEDRIKQNLFKIEQQYKIIAITQTENDALICKKRQSVLKLQDYSKNSQSQSLQLKRSFEVKLKQENVENQFKVKMMHADQQAYFLVTSNPIQLFFASQKTPEIIKINLERQLNLTQPSFYFKKDTLYIYGHNKQQFKNYVYSINLQTFQIKTVCQGKKYAPNVRSQYVSIFYEDRLYVFGGKDKKNNVVDNLLWTFDIEKGYWFALQIKSQIKEIYECQTKQQFYQPGKCLLRADNKLFMVELYQSKCTLIQAQQESLFQSNKNYFTMCLNKNVLFFSQKGQLMQNIKIKAQK